jgi:hypothetical protein
MRTCPLCCCILECICPSLLLLLTYPLPPPPSNYSTCRPQDSWIIDIKNHDIDSSDDSDDPLVSDSNNPSLAKAAAAAPILGRTSSSVAALHDSSNHNNANVNHESRAARRRKKKRNKKRNKKRRKQLFHNVMSRIQPTAQHAWQCVRHPIRSIQRWRPCSRTLLVILCVCLLTYYISLHYNMSVMVPEEPTKTYPTPPHNTF